MSLFHPYPEDEVDQVACHLFRAMHKNEQQADTHYGWIEDAVSRFKPVHQDRHWDNKVRQAALSYITNTVFGPGKDVCPRC